MSLRILTFFQTERTPWWRTYLGWNLEVIQMLIYTTPIYTDTDPCILITPFLQACDNYAKLSAKYATKQKRSLKQNNFEGSENHKL